MQLIGSDRHNLLAPRAIAKVLDRPSGYASAFAMARCIQHLALLLGLQLHEAGSVSFVPAASLIDQECRRRTRQQRCLGFDAAFGCWPSWLAILGLAWAIRSGGAEPALPAAAYGFRAFNVEAGLPHNSAPFVLQTRDGYVWAGTETGLARFDGVRFTTYRTANTPGLPNNWIRALLEDKAGSLWVGTAHGLARYRDGGFENIGLPDQAVVSLAEDGSGRLWIGTYSGELWEYGDGVLTSHTGDFRIPGGPQVGPVFADSTGRVWVGLRTEGLWYREGNSFRRCEATAGEVRAVRQIAESPQNTLWLIADGRVLQLRDGRLRSFAPQSGWGSESLTKIYTDRAGQIWVISNRLYLLANQEKDEFFRAVPVPSVENCRGIIQDQEGSYWIGTAGDGIVRMRPTGFRMFAPEDGQLGGNTRTVAVDRQGAVWAGLAVSGAARIAPDGTISVVTTGTGYDGEVWSVRPASDGSVWIGTRGSLYSWRDGAVQGYPQFKGIRALYQDRAGAIWIGAETGGGVMRYQNGAFTSLDAAIGPNPEKPVAYVFAEDADGALYIGLVRRGVVKVKDGAVTSYESGDGVAAADIRALYPDKEGNLWVGTKGQGLVLLQEGRWWRKDELSSPFNDHVSAVVEDDQGRLWVGSPKGVLWGPKGEFLAVARGQRSALNLHFANQSDGVRPGTVGGGSFPDSAKSPDGAIWFATKRGLATVDPRLVPLNHVVPPVWIERVLVDTKPVQWTDAIRLPAGARTLEVDYTATSFIRPDQVHFRYRLEGHDNDWIEAGDRRTAYYNDLRPGTYRFRVAACNDDGIWNTTGASVTIVQAPFFYQTGWFAGLAALGLAGLGFGLYGWRTAALRWRNEQLERRIAERTAALAERTAELAKSYETIRASEYFYHSLVESLPQIIVRKDAEGRVTYANAAFGELVGRAVDQIIGQRDQDIYPPDHAAKVRADDLRIMQTRQPLEYENVVERPGQKKRYLHVKNVPLFTQQQPIGVLTLFWDMTVFRETEEQLRHAQQELIETSRLAGIAEVATGVLHNLGNALNSVNTSATIAADRLREFRLTGVGKAARLLLDQGDRLVEFFATDPRGRQLPDYLEKLAAHLQAERSEIQHELDALRDNVEHIKEIVAAQQSFAHVSGIVEVVSPTEIIEYALRISEASLTRHHIAVVREFSPVPAVKVERHKVLQILVNLIRNAKDAMNESCRTDKQLVLSVRTSPDGRVQIYATDNGTGIAPENLTRIFSFGFTTKVTGHGFGLHSSALAAKEMGGSLQVQSDGPGKGATFVLELPPAV